MKKNILLVALSLFAIVSVRAESLDLAKSKVFWQGTKVTGRHMGTIGIKSADVKLTNGALTSGTVVVDMNTFTATDLSGEWKDKFNTHLKSADFFEVSKYPTATLKIKEVKGYTVIADLTIMGKTNQVEFLAAQDGKRFFGTLVFDRTKYGVKYGSTSFFKSLGDKAIDNNVSLAFDVTVK